tara:strand:- start:10 stop:219 length:210 start_codon:yes stop_codon:yes gene_type:complete
MVDDPTRRRPDARSIERANASDARAARCVATRRIHSFLADFREDCDCARDAMRISTAHGDAIARRRGDG